MVDLTKKPYHLSEKQIAWVEDAIASMTLEEKIGQLFVLLQAGPEKDANKIAEKLKSFPQGGLRWQGGSMEDAYQQNMAYQKNSKLPLLIACNCDDGGSGCMPEGTFVSTAAQAAAGVSTDTAYHMGLVVGREAGSIGCNWTFNPVADILMNWRNTIVNTRCFGDNADTVIQQAGAFIKGVREGNPHMACCCKHFPGDGVEELDQHLVMGVNNLSVEEWEASFGKVYRSMIDEGVEGIMIGHFAFPAMSKALRPGLKEEDIRPATIAPELLNGLLREKMGFNGVVVTDATHMVGLAAVERRENALPAAIAAGCDMILFANDLEEDASCIREAIEQGVITQERLQDALTRILGLKAKLNLMDDGVRFVDREQMRKWVGCDEHKLYAKQAADLCTTLVKDTKAYLPIKPEKQKRAYLVYVQSTPTTKAYQGDPVRDVVVEELEQAGFQVDVAPNFHDLEVKNGPVPMNTGIMRSHSKRKEFREKYDVVFLVVNVYGYALENNVRLRWSCNHSNELPWYIPEVPTVGISLNYTNHLIDVPQVHTFINAYGSRRENIRAAIDKICGKSEFHGVASETVFCGRWETRL